MADTTLWQQINAGTTEVNQANFAANQQRLQDGIRALNVAGQEIRIWIPNSSNFGHQSTSVHIMYRLAAMGVQRIRIVYEGGEDAWEKLYILILGLEDEPADEYKLNDETTLYFTQSEYQVKPLEVMPLGITGGWDNNKALEARRFRVKNFCCLQPFLWKGAQQPDKSFVPATNVIYTAQNPHEKKPEEWVYKTIPFPLTYRMLQRGYYFDQPALTPKDWKEFEEREQESAELIATIEDLVLKNEALLVPVYFSPGRVVARFHDLFFNLFLGIRSFQERVKAGPVIVLVMSEPQLHGYEALEATFNGSEIYNLSTLDKKRILINLRENSQRYQYLQSMGYLDFLQKDVRLFKDEEITGDKLSEAIETHSLVQVSTLGLPRVVFDYMYGLSNLTMIFEGAGTGNLVMNLGKPFIRVRGADDANTHTYLNMYRTNLAPTTNTPFAKYGEKLAVTMETNADQWNALLDSSSEKLPDEFIGDFLIDANRPYPWLYDAFREQRHFYHSIYEDKLSLALHYWLNLPQPEEEQ